jgi:hypothetical protein
MVDKTPPGNNKGFRRKERRQSPRMPLQRFISYEVRIPLQQGRLLEGKQLRGYLQNISNGGLCFKMKHQLRKTMILKISLPITDIALTVPTLAQVLWVRKKPNHEEYLIGVRFII